MGLIMDYSPDDWGTFIFGVIDEEGDVMFVRDDGIPFRKVSRVRLCGFGFLGF
jgi:hypothetical protein